MNIEDLKQEFKYWKARKVLKKDLKRVLDACECGIDDCNRLETGNVPHRRPAIIHGFMLIKEILKL